MFKLLVPLGLAVSSVSGISAAANADASGVISVNPGLWNWSHRTVLVSFPIEEENTECLPAEQSSISLNDLAEDLGQNCSITDVTENGSGYDFKLACNGIYAGTASGNFTKISDNQVRLTGAGEVSVLGEVGSFTIEANANRVGECPVMTQ